MALISPQAMAVTGTAPTFSTPGASDTLTPVDRGVYLVKTTNASTNVVMTVSGTDEFGQARPDVTVSVDSTMPMKAIPLTAYTRAVDPSTGLITITHSGALTGVTAAYVTI